MKTAYLFPGQGSQYVGMGEDLCRDFPEAKAVFEEAGDVLGLDMMGLCFSGPENELKRTHNTQPAILTHSVAVLRVLGLEPAGDSVQLAGHSLGEYSAYVAAGSLRFDAALRVVRRRGELMYQAGLEQPGTMSAVLGLESEVIERVLGGLEGVVVPANFNSPGQVVISGEVEAVGAAAQPLKDAGAKRVIPLEVSGAFHSSLMGSAASGLKDMISSIEIAPARARVLANETAGPVVEPEEIRASLVRQLLSPVRWEEIIRSMLDWGAERFLELGPGKVLSGLTRAVDRRVTTTPIGTSDQVRAFLKETESDS